MYLNIKAEVIYSNFTKYRLYIQVSSAGLSLLIRTTGVFPVRGSRSVVAALAPTHAVSVVTTK